MEKNGNHFDIVYGHRDLNIFRLPRAYRSEIERACYFVRFAAHVFPLKCRTKCYTRILRTYIVIATNAMIDIMNDINRQKKRVFGFCNIYCLLEGVLCVIMILAQCMFKKIFVQLFHFNWNFLYNVMVIGILCIHCGISNKFKIKFTYWFIVRR